MPFFDRPLVTDRPTVIDPVIGNGDEEEQRVEENSTEQDTVETLGDGGGEVVHGLEFEEGQEDIIKSSNLVAILATGQEEGKLYSDVFKNAAFQLAEVKENGHTTEGVVSLSEDLNVAYLGTSESDLGDGEEESEPDEDVSEEDEQPDGDEEQTEESEEEQVEEVEEDEETSEE